MQLVPRDIHAKTGHTGGFQPSTRKMKIDTLGPPVCADDIARIEQDLDAKLPADYKKFLLQFNGGAPTPDTVDVLNAPDMPTDVQVFFGIGRPVRSSDLFWNLAFINKRCFGQHLLPIACDSGGNLFCLRVERDETVEVVYCDLDQSDCVMYFVASSFSEFFNKLRPFQQ